MRASATYSGVRGAAHRYKRPRSMVRAAWTYAAPLLRCGLLLGWNLRAGGAMTYLDDCGAPQRGTARSGAP